MKEHRFFLFVFLQFGPELEREKSQSLLALAGAVLSFIERMKQSQQVCMHRLICGPK